MSVKNAHEETRVTERDDDAGILRRHVIKEVKILRGVTQLMIYGLSIFYKNDRKYTVYRKYTILWRYSCDRLSSCVSQELKDSHRVARLFKDGALSSFLFVVAGALIECDLNLNSHRPPPAAELRAFKPELLCSSTTRPHHHNQNSQKAHQSHT